MILIVCRYVNIEIRKTAQHNEKLYGVVMTIDMMEFVMNGGGSFGYENYFKWSYAKWRNDEKRTFFEKIMFWNAGILYYAANPPEEYQYPLVKNK